MSSETFSVTMPCFLMHSYRRWLALREMELGRIPGDADDEFVAVPIHASPVGDDWRPGDEIPYGAV